MQRLIYLSILIFIFSQNIFSQVNDTLVGVPVIYKNDTLFFLYDKIGPFSVENRIDAFEERLDTIREVFDKNTDTITYFVNEKVVDIQFKKQVILSITPKDARYACLSLEQAGDTYAQKLQKVFQNSAYFNWRGLLLNLLILIGALLVLYYGTKLINRIFLWFELRIRRFDKNMIFQNNRFTKLFEYITPEREKRLLLFLSKTIRLVIIMVALFFYVTALFSVLPWTREVFGNLFDQLMKPVRASWHNFVAFIPDLLFIIVVIVGARYLIKLLRFFSKELAGERLKIAGFYPDWARPTFNLIRFVIYILVLVITVPYLPFFESKAFRGISIFMGVLLSFGSSTAVSNIIAGLVLTYMRPFVIGDRVKIGETIGDVKEKTLLVTRVRTIKNEDISIPNANILNNHLKNFTKNARDLGIILHTSVTIGYDVSWKKVHELLLSAADKCELAEKEPKPFIFQKSLDDFYVNYELNIHTKQAGKMAFIYSELHKHILDAFNNEGIEILSPHYSALRDGHSLTIPKENVPKDYKKPGFSMGI